jgi:hypothetical protein
MKKLILTSLIVPIALASFVGTARAQTPTTKITEQGIQIKKVEQAIKKERPTIKAPEAKKTAKTRLATKISKGKKTGGQGAQIKKVKQGGVKTKTPKKVIKTVQKIIK